MGFLVYVIVMLIFFSMLAFLFAPKDMSWPLTPLIPFLGNAILEMGLILLLILPLSSVIGVLIGCYALSPIFLFLHKRFYGSQMSYGIQIKSESIRELKLSQSIYPSLMAINFAFVLQIPEILNVVVDLNTTITAESLSTGEGISAAYYAFSFIVLLMLTFILAVIIFSAIWCLLQSGVTYDNKKKVINDMLPEEVRSVGGIFNTIFKGYAGISVIITYSEFLIPYLTAISPGIFSTGIIGISNLIFWPLFPVLLMICMIPGYLVYKSMAKKMIENLRKKARKKGISDVVELSFQVKKPE